MPINFSIFRDCKHQGRTEATLDTVGPISYTSVNLREEYANAFRTQSYTHFWSRAGPIPTSHPLLADLLLDPDQPTVTQILTHSRTHHPLLPPFYSLTASASLLLSRLLSHVHHLRTRYPLLKSAIRPGSDNPLPLDPDFNPFSPLTFAHFHSIRTAATSLLTQLDSTRKKTRSKLRLLARIKRGLAAVFILVAATASLAGAWIAVHGLIALAALPGLIWNSGRLDRLLGQLDAAAKGTYILNRDLDTISRLVGRLKDEVEHVMGLVKFWRERKEVREEVAKEITKNDVSFVQKLDELEEHLYLCFVTINKARGIVTKEVMAPQRSKN